MYEITSEMHLTFIWIVVLATFAIAVSTLLLHLSHNHHQDYTQISHFGLTTNTTAKTGNQIYELDDKKVKVTVGPNLTLKPHNTASGVPAIVGTVYTYNNRITYTSSILVTGDSTTEDAPFTLTVDIANIVDNPQMCYVMFFEKLDVCPTSFTGEQTVIDGVTYYQSSAQIRLKTVINTKKTSATCTIIDNCNATPLKIPVGKYLAINHTFTNYQQ